MTKKTSNIIGGINKELAVHGLGIVGNPDVTGDAITFAIDYSPNGSFEGVYSFSTKTTSYGYWIHRGSFIDCRNLAEAAEEWNAYAAYDKLYSDHHPREE